MTWLAGLSAVFKGFFASLWEAMRRKRQDQELADKYMTMAENASLKHSQEASKKARKVDDEISADERHFDDIIDRM